MLPTIVELLLAYGICFGSMNKVDFFHEKSEFTDALLKCAYCTGFHAGWLAWLLTLPLRGLPEHLWLIPVQVLVWAFASSVFCYGADTVFQLAESWVRKEDE